MTVTDQKIKELPIEFKMNDDVVQQTKAFLLLEVTIDEQLTYNEQISNTCKKTNQRVGVLKRLRNLILTGAKLVFYKTAILPHITYCGLADWYSTYAGHQIVENLKESKNEP